MQQATYRSRTEAASSRLTFGFRSLELARLLAGELAALACLSAAGLAVLLIAASYLL